MLEVCRLSPAPAMQLGDAADDWEINPAARSWALTAAFDASDWQQLADSIRAERLDDALAKAAPRELKGVAWETVPIEGGLLAWLVPVAAARNIAGTLPVQEAVGLLDVTVWRIDLDDGRLYTNERGYVLIGMNDPPPGEGGVALDRVRANVHPDDLVLLAKSFENSLRPGAGVVDVHARYRQPDGSYRALMTRRIVERDGSGRAVGMIGVSVDVTAQLESTRREEEAAEGLRLLIEASSISAWIADPASRSITLYGETDLLYGPGVVRTMSIREAQALVLTHLHPDDRELVQRAFHATRDPDFRASEWSFRALRGDGGVRWMVARARRRDGPNGPHAAHATAGVVIDVTDQREALERLRHAERRAAMAAEFAGFGVWQFDIVTGERYWDAQMFRLRGVDPSIHIDLDTVRERSISAEAGTGLTAVLEEVRRMLDDGSLPEYRSTPTLEYQVVWPDGSRHWIGTRAHVVREEGKNPQLLGLNWDINAVKIAQELRREREAAEEASQAKSRFLANMSHEIRTPMNAILGMANLALRTQLDGRQHNYLTKIERSATTLLGIINDILDFSKIEADKIELERIEFPLADVFGDLGSLVGLQAEEKGVELIFVLAPTLPARLIGDPLRLGQVLVNLAANAIKFTARGGEVAVSVATCSPDAAGERGITLRFVVSDSGIGMTTKYLERLFQPFEQADASTSRQHGGSGLGLAISQRLVQTMGSKLEVSSVPGQGSTFAFDIAFDLPQFEAAASTPLVESVAALKGLRVLVVDDHERARAALLELCAAHGVEVEGCGDPWDGLRMLGRTRQTGKGFDLVLLDADLSGVGMGMGMGPVEYARELREAAQASPAIVYLATANARDALQRNLDSAGLAHCSVVAKPVLPDALRDAMCQAVGRPWQAEPEASAVRPAGPASRIRDRLQGAEILLVDDNEINRELATEILGEAGLRVTTAEDGQQALDMLCERRFDAVLMDCQMPVMDGYEATVAIRREPRWQGLPVIAMTANAMSGDRERAIACGMNDHIAKPIDIESMFAILTRWIPTESLSAGRAK